MKKVSKLISFVLVAMPMLVSCVEKGNTISTIVSSEEQTSQNTSQSKKDYQIEAISPLDGGSVSLASEEISDMYENYSFAYSEKYVKGVDCYAARDAYLSWSNKEEALYYTVDLSESGDFSTYNSYLTNETSLTIDSLLPGHTYFWRVNAQYEDKIIRSRPFEFVTLAIPKSYYMGSVKNFRDMGGYHTSFDNKRVKSGMIFRGANADSVSSTDRDFMLNTLNITTELDLRNKNEGKRGTNYLGVANYQVADDNGGLYYDSNPNGISKEAGQEVLAREIKLFANRDNYPIYYHCAIGRDRTGSLAMVLYNLLGVEKKDIAFDYEISMFAAASTNDIVGKEGKVSELLDQVFLIYNYIYRYSGKNMQEKTNAFLLDIGVSQEEINSIRDIMLEDM